MEQDATRFSTGRIPNCLRTACAAPRSRESMIRFAKGTIQPGRQYPPRGGVSLCRRPERSPKDEATSVFPPPQPFLLNRKTGLTRLSLCLSRFTRYLLLKTMTLKPSLVQEQELRGISNTTRNRGIRDAIKAPEERRLDPWNCHACWRRPEDWRTSQPIFLVVRLPSEMTDLLSPIIQQTESEGTHLKD